MTGSGRSPDVAAAGRTEWTGRLLVVLQFGLLALMGARAWIASSSVDLLTTVLLSGSASLALWSLAANRPGNFNIRPAPRPGGALVTSGPYRWIRHPMYTSVLAAAAAAAVASHQVVDAVLWLLLLAVLGTKAGMEERALMRQFPDYPSYTTRTTRFLPWLI